METQFVKSQKQKLRMIIKKNSSTSLHKHLGLPALQNVQNFDDMYEHFKRQVPVYTFPAYINALQRMTGHDNATPIELYKHHRLVNDKEIKNVAITSEALMPVSDQQLSGVFQIEKHIAESLRKQNAYNKGKIFQIFENHSFDDSFGINIGAPGALYNRARPWPWHKNYTPSAHDLEGIGKSRYQTLHGFIDMLEKYGKQVEVLVAKPRAIAEISLLLAQRESRFVPISELCPNLKTYIHYGMPITSYRKELSYIFAGLDLVNMELYTTSTGAVAIQDDLNIKTWLKLCDDTGVFYEFVPEEDVDSFGKLNSRFRRYNADQVELNKNYLMIINNASGILGYISGDVVKIVSKEPFRISYQCPVEKLNHFEEALTLTEFEKLLAEINEALAPKGVFIREYMIGDDVDKKQQHWILELSRPASEVNNKILQTIANRIHSELCLQNKSYYNVYKLGNFNLPKVTFVSMGTFSNLPENLKFTHMDRTSDVLKIKKVMSRAWSKITVTAEQI